MLYTNLNIINMRQRLSTRHYEDDLRIPILNYLRARLELGATKKQIKKHIEETVNWSLDDLRPSNSQNAPVYSQIITNTLSSNDTLKNGGYVDIVDDLVKITSKGLNLLSGIKTDRTLKAVKKDNNVLKVEETKSQVKEETPDFSNVPEDQYEGVVIDVVTKKYGTDSTWSSDVKRNFGNKGALTRSKYALQSCHIVDRSIDSSVINDRNNGICLRADIHILFGDGLIGFTDDGRLLVSPLLKDDISTYNLSPGQKLFTVTPGMVKYLKRHRLGRFLNE